MSEHSADNQCSPSRCTSESSAIGDEDLWRILAWVLSIVGAVLALALAPKTKSIRHWAYLSISFFIVVLGAWLVVALVSLIPIIGGVLATAVWVIVVIVWIIGLIKCINKEEWAPPLIYDIAKMIAGGEI